MSSLRDMMNAVPSSSDGYAALEYKKGDHATGEGDQYEERMLALAFLRCLRRGLLFQLSANNGDAGKFNDLVLVWGPDKRALLVQLKHKTSPNSMTIHPDTLLSNASKCAFGLSMYCTSYEEISEQLEMDRVKVVLQTNACLSDDCLTMFEQQDMGSLPGLELLHTDGHLYRINPNNEQVLQAVHGNTSFVEHFYLLCKQRNHENVMKDIYRELEALLGAGDLCGSISDSLCKIIRVWMNKESVCLTRDWSKWQALVHEYVQEEVTACRAVSTSLKYCSVPGVQRYLMSCNPAWLRPPKRGTEALSATKVHQALAGETHIMVDVERYTVLRHRILCCWGRYCRWLVIVDDDKGSSSDILDELLNKVNKVQTECRLVIVSSRGNDCFVDTCRSSDVSDDSWEEFLEVSVRLNGERYECLLRDLVAGVDDLKSLLDGQPELLLTLARLSQPLRMGRELETLPEYYVPRNLVNWRPVTDEFLSSLRGWDVCITDSVSYESLKRKIGRHLVESREMGSWFVTALEFECPLILLNDDLQITGEKCRRQSFDIYIVRKISDNRWKVHYYSEPPPPEIRERARDQVKGLLETLDTASNAVIVEGRPGVGKSTLLSDVAKRIKQRDSACWLLRINLWEFYSVLDDSGSAESAVKDILRRTAFSKDELGRLEYTLLCHSLLESPRVVCLVDGFDEVCPDYVEKCLAVLPLLAPRKGKLVVTTRPEPLKFLEAQMDVLAHSLAPFSDSELKEFFTHHSSMGKISPISSLHKRLRDLLRIPLFAEMFASVSQTMSKRYDIVSLYEAFFQKKFIRLYEEKSGDNTSAPGKKFEIKKAQEEHEKQLMLLAASALLRSTEMVEKPLLSGDYFVKPGIVYMFPDGKPAFLHKTFAEHFLAKWCFNGVREPSCAAAYREAYLDGTLTFFQESFDRRAVKGHPLLEALLEALPGGYVGKVLTLLSSSANLWQTDACGRNALHLVVGYREERSLPLLKWLCRHATVGALSAKDDMLGWTPMRYAAERGHCDSVEELVAVGGDLGHLGSFGVGSHDPAQLDALFRQGGYLALYQHVFRVNHASGGGEAVPEGIMPQMEFAVSVISANMEVDTLNHLTVKAKEEGHMQVFHLLSTSCNRRLIKPILTEAWWWSKPNILFCKNTT